MVESTGKIASRVAKVPPELPILGCIWFFIQDRVKDGILCIWMSLSSEVNMKSMNIIMPAPQSTENNHVKQRTYHSLKVYSSPLMPWVWQEELEESPDNSVYIFQQWKKEIVWGGS